jgi:prepilin-type N-terminal cleavage/methylation domain-containing protein
MTMDIGMFKKRATRAAGFTLIEILLVIVIILLLAGALVVFVLPQQEGAEKNTTKLLLANVARRSIRIASTWDIIRRRMKAASTR